MNPSADYLQCRRVVRQQSRILSAALAGLPNQQRQGLHALFAFSFSAFSLPEQDFSAFSRGATPDRYPWRALRDTLEQLNIQGTDRVGQIFYGNKEFHQTKQYQSMEQLLAAFDNMAGATAELAWRIVSPFPERFLAPLRVALGRAVLLTDVLHNVNFHLSENRIPFPRDMMKRHGYTDQMLEQRKVNDAFVSMWEEMAAIAEECYAAARPLAKHLHPRAKFPLLAAAVLYRELLMETRRVGHQVFNRPVYLPLFTRFRALSQLQTN